MRIGADLPVTPAADTSAAAELDRGEPDVTYGGSVLESYSAPARRAISLATAEARQLGHPRVGTEHLLLGLLADGSTATAQTLQAAGASLAAARHKVIEASGLEPGSMSPADLELTPRARRALERAGRFSRQDREPEARPEHLVLGVLDVEGLACQVLRGLGVDLGRLRDELVNEAEVVEPASTVVEAAPARIAVRPRCPSCTAMLDDTLTVVEMPARRDGDAEETTVHVVYCGACGTALGALPSHD